MPRKVSSRTNRGKRNRASIKKTKRTVKNIKEDARRSVRSAVIKTKKFLKTPARKAARRKQDVLRSGKQGPISDSVRDLLIKRKNAARARARKNQKVVLDPKKRKQKARDQR